MNSQDFEKLVVGLKNTLALANQKPSRAKKSPYLYRECGLDGIVLVNGYKRVETSYGAGISIIDVDGLHQAIARALARKPTALSAREANFFRKHMTKSPKSAVGPRRSNSTSASRSRTLRFKRDRGVWKRAI